jgi:multiple sugar transport system permease protein
MKPGRRSLALRYTALTLLAVAFLLPFYVIARNAFSTQQWITAPAWHWLPDAVGVQTLTEVLSDQNLGVLSSLGNSAIVSTIQTAGTVLLAMMAGYGMARWTTRAARLVTGLTVFTLMVPTTVTFVPMFVMVSSLGWISSYRGLIVPGLFSAFAAYLFRTAFLDFPQDLEDAAAIDGANPWTTFWRIVVPNSLGMVAAVGTITFIGTWNAFLWPLLIAQDPGMRTVQVALSQLMTSQGIRYPEMFMGALIAVAPALVVFSVLQRWLVQGVTQSGLK